MSRSHSLLPHCCPAPLFPASHPLHPLLLHPPPCSHLSPCLLSLTSSLCSLQSLWKWRGVSSDGLRAQFLGCLPCLQFLQRARIADMSAQHNTSSSSSSHACAGFPALRVFPAQFCKAKPQASESKINQPCPHGVVLGSPRLSPWLGLSSTRLHAEPGPSKGLQGLTQIQEPASTAHVRCGKRREVPHLPDFFTGQMGGLLSG